MIVDWRLSIYEGIDNWTFLGSSKTEIFSKSTTAYKGAYTLEKALMKVIGNLKKIRSDRKPTENVEFLLVSWYLNGGS